MCCQIETHHDRRCGPGHISYGCGIGTHFLSKKKRIELLTQHLDGLRERVRDAEGLIEELKDEK
jgi:hypothetical protein